MSICELLKLLPKNIFSELAAGTKVNHQVKKHSGEVIFKLILFSMLNAGKLSLRVTESFLTTAAFRSFPQPASLESRYNSIRDRICNIEAACFEKLLEKIFATYNAVLKQ